MQFAMLIPQKQETVFKIEQCNEEAAAEGLYISYLSVFFFVLKRQFRRLLLLSYAKGQAHLEIKKGAQIRSTGEDLEVPLYLP